VLPPIADLRTGSSARGADKQTEGQRAISSSIFRSHSTARSFAKQLRHILDAVGEFFHAQGSVPRSSGRAVFSRRRMAPTAKGGGPHTNMGIWALVNQVQSG
jgi:hypothetical protein